MQASRKNKEYMNNLQTSFCAACLSTDRKLFVLLELRDIYQQLCKNIVRVNKSLEVYLCWECRAFLRNVKKFQDRVLKSQKRLKRYFKNEKKIFSKSFSNLTSTKPYILFDSTDLKDVDVKPETIEIKQEKAIFDDDVSNEFESEPLEEIKADDPETLNEFQDIPIDIDETDLNFLKYELSNKTNPITQNLYEVDKEITKVDEPKSLNDKEKDICSVKQEFNPIKLKRKKEPTKRVWLKMDRSKLYRINGKRKDSQANCYSREPIQPHEVAYWMERERQSDYFKKLKKKCYKCLARVISVKKHKESHSKDRKYICDFCGVSFALKGALKLHVSNHLWVRRCAVCGYRCLGKLHMYQHSRRQHGAMSLRVVECLACDATFSRTWEFYDHYRQTHYELRNVFYCDHCNRRFLQRRTIEKHIKRKHSPQVCKVCDMTFNTYSGLKQHIMLKHRIERTEASYCVQCDRQFDNVAQYKLHVHNSAAHAGERKKPTVVEKQRHQCPLCPNNYAKITYMRNHYNRIHAAVPRFICELCEKTFTTNSRLREHIRYSHEGHTRPKNKICSVCGRGFNAKSVLVKHMRTHTGERPYSCPLCSAAFTQRTAMLTHVKSIHKRETKMLAAHLI